MTMENLLTPVILTIGFILAGTHTTNAQCEFNHIIIHYTLGHWDNSGRGDILDVYMKKSAGNSPCYRIKYQSKVID